MGYIPMQANERARQYGNHVQRMHPLITGTPRVLSVPLLRAKYRTFDKKEKHRRARAAEIHGKGRRVDEKI